MFPSPFRAQRLEAGRLTRGWAARSAVIWLPEQSETNDDSTATRKIKTRTGSLQSKSRRRRPTQNKRDLKLRHTETELDVGSCLPLGNSSRLTRAASQQVLSFPTSSRPRGPSMRPSPLYLRTPMPPFCPPPECRPSTHSVCRPCSTPAGTSRHRRKSS